MACGLWLVQCSLRPVAQGTWSDECQEWPANDVLHHRRHLVLGNALCVWSDAVEQELGNLSRYVRVSLHRFNSLLCALQYMMYYTARKLRINCETSVWCLSALSVVISFCLSHMMSSLKVAHNCIAAVDWQRLYSSVVYELTPLMCDNGWTRQWRASGLDKGHARCVDTASIRFGSSVRPVHVSKRW